MFVDIILPLPLDGMFTYSVPLRYRNAVKCGVRVLVPFGNRNKSCTGLVAKVHGNAPGFEVKDISAVLDDVPVANESQLELWQWIADYYMSSVGEVYDAAFPSALKTDGSYTPKTDIYVMLAPGMRDERSVRNILGILKKTPAQRKAFEAYLSLSGWSTPQGFAVNAGCVKEISRDELLNESHSTLATFRKLVEQKFLVAYDREVGRLNYGGEPCFSNIKPLSEVQQKAYDGILFGFLRKDITLLHGVTSSGKTEIYMHLIRRAIENKQQVLYLLPEIALTVQIRQRLQKVFGNRLGIYHSKYSDAERVEIWKKQLSESPYDVILGARSAVFLPFSRLGLVIIDEEHETSFKQQDPAPRYHARSVAIMLARMSGAKVLLGSATPSVESYHNCGTGKYALVPLMERHAGMQLPEIRIVDIKDLQRRKMMSGPFSPVLLSAVRQALDNGNQVILFQNRRGFAPMIECRECGWTPHCNVCDVSLSYHKRLGVLTCHYCGKTYAVPDVCPCCGSRNLRGVGCGTEKVEERVMDLFPEARVARMDLDTTRSRTAYERIIGEFSAHKTDILIGTQMVSKGLDFDRVSVVGIMNADSMLNYPDFRAYEHAFTMMSQVAGRAGRKNSRGLVILQTKSPQLPLISQVVNNDYAAFYSDILDERQAFRYPPFCRLVYVYLKHRSDDVVEGAALAMGELLRGWFGSRVLGPDKPAVAKVKSLNIRKIMLKLETGIDLAKARLYLRKGKDMVLLDKRFRGVHVYFDVDPS